MSLPTIFNSKESNILYALENTNIVLLISPPQLHLTSKFPIFLYQHNWTNKTQKICHVMSSEDNAVSAARLAIQENPGVSEHLFGCVSEYNSNSDNIPSKEKVVYTSFQGLINKIMADSLLTEFSVIVVEILRERAADCDILLFMLKKILRKRAELKLVLAIEIPNMLQVIIDYFTSKKSNQNHDISVVDFSIKSDHVDMHYLDEPSNDYFASAIETVKKIHTCEDEGDILVFLTGRKQVDKATSVFMEYYEKSPKKLNLVPFALHSGTSSEELSYILQPQPIMTRKVIFCTNIAENMDNIEGIRYVVVSGIKKETVYDSVKKSTKLVLKPISKAACLLQSSKAAGFLGSKTGSKCYNLYPFVVYKTVMPELDCPEINRIGGTQLAKYLLKLLVLTGPIDASATFDIIEPGFNERNLVGALEILQELGCFYSQSSRIDVNIVEPKPESVPDAGTSTSTATGTDAGANKGVEFRKNYEIIKKLALFNVEPQFGVCLLAGFETQDLSESKEKRATNFLPQGLTNQKFSESVMHVDVSVEMLAIVSMMSLETVFTGSNQVCSSPSRQKNKFAAMEGDHLTLLNTFLAFFNKLASSHSHRGNHGDVNTGHVIYFCKKHNLNHKQLQKNVQLAKQLLSVYLEKHVTDYDLRNIVDKYTSNLGYSLYRKKSELIRKCLLRGLFENVAELQSDNSSYKNLNSNQVMYIHPNSCLFHSIPKYVVYTKTVESTKIFMVDVSAIEPDWVAEINPSEYKLE